MWTLRWAEGPARERVRALTSCLRSMTRIWSSVLIDGERPPWTQKILSSMIDERER